MAPWVVLSSAMRKLGVEVGALHSVSRPVSSGFAVVLGLATTSASQSFIRSLPPMRTGFFPESIEAPP